MIGPSTFTAVLLLASLAHAQGDPPRIVDSARRPGAKLRIDLIGDSTQTNNAGYGRGFCANFTAAVRLQQVRGSVWFSVV